ncbi:MAG: dTMP kinase [Chloroflexi bacterium]|nr:dTMP kinase [Chloroflexota bacterium]
MGLFITFEGGEGTGKTTQARILAERLAPALLLHEPGGTPLGEALAAWLRESGREVSFPRFLRPWSRRKSWGRLDSVTELFLFAAARAQLVASVIRPALEWGDTVICDRFADSTVAYQGYGRGLDLAQVAQVNALATQGLRPHLTVLLGLSVEEGLRRTRGASHRMEQEGAAFHERVRQGYLEMARQEPDRWLVLNARLPIEETARRVWERVQALRAGA